MPDVTVVIPTIPPRKSLLDRAVASAAHQTVPVSIVVEADHNRTGSAATRNRALAKVESEWLICLDDDDVLMPNAVQVLAEAQEATGADVISGGAWIPEVPGHREPVEVPAPGWIPQKTVRARSVLHVTSLIRTELLREAGGFQFRRDPGNGMMLDDYGAYCALAELGATFWRVPETVLIWYWHGANTSGKGDRWLAGLPVKPKLLGECSQLVRRLQFPGIGYDSARHDGTRLVSYDPPAVARFPGVLRSPLPALGGRAERHRQRALRVSAMEAGKQVEHVPGAFVCRRLCRPPWLARDQPHPHRRSASQPSKGLDAVRPEA